MANDELGWIRLYRKIISSQVFQNDALLKVWIWCLAKATHKPMWVPMRTGRGETEVRIERGQFIFGRKTAAKELKMHQSSVRNRLKKLKDMQNLDIQSNTHYSIVTVLNWDSYQIDDEEEDRQEDNQRTTKGQPKDTYKNVKNNKNKNIYTPAEAVVDFGIEIGMPAPRTPASRKKMVGVVRARLKDTWDPEDLKAHLRRYVLKRQVHERYLKKYKVSPEIKSSLWCPNVDWKIWEVLSPQRLETYFEIWKKEGFETEADLIAEYKRSSERKKGGTSQDWDLGKAESRPQRMMSVKEAEAYYNFTVERVKEHKENFLSVEDEKNPKKVKAYEDELERLGELAEEAFYALASVREYWERAKDGRN